MNTYVSTPVSFFTGGMPICIVRQTAAQSLTSGAWTALLFDTEEVDRDGMHSTVTNTSRLTAVTAGYYWSAGISAFSANATGPRGAALSINGTRVAGRAAECMAVTAGSTNTATPTASIVFLNVGDYLELQALQTSGGSLNTSVLSDVQSSLSVLWVSTA